MKKINESEGSWVSQAEVIRYIMAVLMERCTDTPLPFRERETARILGANRLTVHKAAISLFQEKALIRLEGRRGLFLNPEHRKRGKSVKYYGAVSGWGQAAILNHPQTLVMNGFFENIREFHYVDVEYLRLKSSSVDAITAEILAMPLRGLIWFSPAEEMFPVIDSLLKKGFPVLVIHTGIIPGEVHFHTNALHMDFTDMGRAFADKVLELNYPKLLFAGCRCALYDSFRERLSRQGYPYSETDFMEYESKNADPARLMKRIRQEKIPLVVSDGTVFHDLELLKEYGDLSGVHFLFRPMDHVRKRARYCPEYNISFPDYLCDETLKDMGRIAAEKLEAQTPEIYFENTALKLIKTKTLSGREVQQ